MSRQEEIGERIQKSRKAQGLNQTELAEKLGKTLRTIQKYESGEIEVSISTINTIATILEISPAYLIGYDREHIRIETMADVLQFFFKLDDIVEISFEIDNKRIGRDGKFETTITFHGDDRSASYNGTVCQRLEQFEDYRQARASYFGSDASLKSWEEKDLAYYSKDPLHEKQREELPFEEVIRRRTVWMEEQQAKRKAKQDDN